MATRGQILMVIFIVCEGLTSRFAIFILMGEAWYLGRESYWAVW